MKYKLFIPILIIPLVLVMQGCVSNGSKKIEKNYASTPYSYYAHLTEKNQVEELKIISKDSANYYLHDKIMRQAIDKKRWVLVLYALKELHKLSKNNQKVNHNIAILLNSLGQQLAAKARLEYVIENAKDKFVENRAMAALIKLEKNLPMEMNMLFRETYE